MTRDEIDVMWQQALHQSVQDGEQFTRYRFAALVAAKEREACYRAVRGASLIIDGVALTATQTLSIYEQLSAPIRARKP